MRVRNIDASSRTSVRKSTRFSAVKYSVSFFRSHCHSASDSFMTSSFAFTRSIAVRRASSSCARSSFGALDVVRRRQPPRLLRRAGGAVAVRRARVALLGELADGVHVAKILPAVGVDDHRRLERRRLVVLPQEEVLSVALEGDFDEHEVGRRSWSRSSVSGGG